MRRQLKRKIAILGLCLTLISGMTACGEPKNKENANVSEVKESFTEAEGAFESNGASENTFEKTRNIDKESASQGMESEGESEKESKKESAEGNEEENAGGTSGGTVDGTSGGTSGGADSNFANKILGNYEILGSRYDIYKNAYRTGDTAGFSEDQLTFYMNMKQCLDEANSKGTKVEKEKAVHDWMILNCEYDKENYYNGTIPWNAYKPEGVFIDKKVVCNGYALAFQLCMDILGIESKIVVGRASNDDHAWNIVKMDDGCWYHVDVTWDDPGSDREIKLNNTFFNVTDDYMRNYGRHSFQINETCNATQYGYWECFERETLHVYSKDELYTGIINWINSGKYEGIVAMEHNCSEYDSYEKVYDFNRVCKATNKDLIYRFDIVYEEEGRTYFPNGCGYAKFSVSFGDNEEVVKYISSHEEYGRYIQEFSAADNACRIFNFYLDPELLNHNDFSLTFVKTKAVKAVQYVNEEYLPGEDTYHIYMAFDYNNDTLYTMDQLKARFDEYYNKGTGTYTINYYAGLSGDTDSSIINTIKPYLKEKYGVERYHSPNEKINWYVERNYEMDQTYTIDVSIK
ncbi:MAG: transglutaminase domain-containing protein [Eubacteriales bacterium]|nr:transglutaminase domain-containing protein [Eubacteriales bacterium]